MSVRRALQAHVAVVVLVLVSLMAMPSSAFAVAKLGLSAGRFQFALPAGGQASGVVIVSDDGDEPLKVKVYASDMVVDQAGSVTYKTPTPEDLTALQLPSSWTTIKMPANSKSFGNVPYLELAPSQRIPVKFSFVVPPTATPGDHNVVIFFEAFQPPTPGKNTQSLVFGRLGSRVTLRIQGPFVQKLDVRPFDVPQWLIGDNVPWSFVVRNTGNLDQRVTSNVTLIDRSGNQLAQKTAINALTVFASSNLAASGNIAPSSGLGLGEYNVHLDVVPVDDSGKPVDTGAKPVSEALSVWLIPRWLVITAVAVVGALVVLLVVWIVVAGRRRRAARESRAYERGREEASPAAQPRDDMWNRG
jgi:hypothetical protein